MLLAVTEDRATLRSDPSAIAGFSGESDAGRVTLFLFSEVLSPPLMLGTKSFFV
jgi:hypothetical protein